MSGTTTLPLIMTDAGPQLTPVTTIQSTTIANAATLSPGYTAALPGSMVEDIVSTSIAAIMQANQWQVDAVNSVSPYAANPFVLALIGAQIGLPQGTTTNSSVDVAFTVTSGGAAVAGFQVPAGTLVSDGTYQYATQTTVTTAANGVTPRVAAVATQSGTWAIAAGAVTTVVTSFPSPYAVSVTNASAGIAGTGVESVQSYRSRVLTAEQFTVQGTPAAIYTALAAIPGMQSRTINTIAASGGLKVLCALTADQNLIAGAIYQTVPDITTLQGSDLAITGISAATNAIITTNTNSNLSPGTVLTVTGASPAAYNTSYTVSFVSGTQITTSTNSSAFGTYTSGATFNPNPRNVSVTISDTGSNYSVLFVNPPPQTVTGSVTWNTDLVNFYAGAQVNNLAAAALVNYVNGLTQGQSLNIDVMTATFQTAITSVLPAQHLTALTFAINVNGVATSPNVGTVIIPGDSESYWAAAANAFTVTQA